MYNPFKSVANLTTRSNRGQAYIVEAITALLLLAAVLIAVSSTLGVISPSISPSDKQTQSELRSDVAGAVQSAQTTGELKQSLLNWNASDRRYDDYGTLQSERGYYLAYPNGRFGSRLSRIADRHNGEIAVEIVPTATPNGETASTLNTVEPNGTTVISGGTTTKTVVVEETYITVFAGDQLNSPDSHYTHQSSPRLPGRSQTTVKEAYTSERNRVANTSNQVDELYLPFPPKTNNYSTIEKGEVWNVYRVRVIAWF
jgi:hypothetical protein